MQMSNDVKWNKIKQIEKILRNDINYDPIDIYLQQGIYSDSEAIKLADCDIWILANKLYDIATEGFKKEWQRQSSYPIDRASIVARINRVGYADILSDEDKISEIYSIWEHYYNWLDC